jgi:Tfp pilus assembly protein PilF
MFRRLQFLLHRFRAQSQTATPSIRQTLSVLLDNARRAQYAEEYEQAQSLLQRASELADQEQDRRAQIDITLSRADVAIAGGSYELASHLLEQLRKESEERQQRAPLAYTLSSLGLIAQKQQRWDEARNYFEMARNTATAIRADGASGRATGHLADVYLQEGNFSYAAYLLNEALPRLRRSGDRELLGYFQGQLARAMFGSGQDEAALATLRAAIESAFAIRHRSQLRYLHQFYGSEQLKRGDFSTARQHLEQALALYSSEPTPEKARLLSDLSKVCLSTGEPQSALTYAIDALQTASALQQEAIIRHARGVLGLAKLENGDPQQALELLQAAVQDTDTDSNAFNIRRRIARLLLEQNQPAQAEQLLRSIIEQACQQHPAEAARAAAQLATIQQQRHEYRAAIESARQAQSFFDAATLRPQALQTQCDVAMLYMEMGDGRMAQREYAQVLESLSAIRDPEIRGSILANSANAYTDLGDIESAEEFYKEAIALAHNAGQTALEARRRGNYGRFLALTNRPRQALIELQEATQQSSSAGLAHEQAVQKGNIALALAASGDHESALLRYEEADQELALLPDPVFRACFLAHSADSCVLLGQLQAASTRYEQALQTAKATQQHALSIHALLGLAEIAILSEDLQTARSHLLEAEPLAKRSASRRLIARWYEAHAALLDLQQQPAQAESARQEAARLRTIMRMPPAPAIQRR